jgi:hypothetical protein
MDRLAKEQELERLREQVARLEQELAIEQPVEWPPKGYYFTYHLLAGLHLGLFGALTSLIFNIVGSLLVKPPPPLTPDPLNLIRVYLTFPMGEAALSTGSGVALAIGCCLYLATGSFLGVPFQLAQSWLWPSASLTGRLVLASFLAIGIWLLNFYVILSWLQPLLFGGDWIVELIPWWVGMLTHLVFGWTMAVVYPLGVFKPYRQ